MDAQLRRKRKLTIAAVLFLVMIMSVSVHASAEWKKNSNGAYVWYQNGVLQKSRWVDGDYYVTSNGTRKTGWMTLKKKKYYFAKSGKVLRSQWIKYKGKLYYAGKDGAMLTGGRHKIGEEYYAFDKNGARIVGRHTYGKKTYYFGKQTGKMQKNRWVVEKNKQYYYGEDGVLAKNCWIGSFYVGKDGVRLKNTWKDQRYLDKNGKALSGLQKVGNYTYYFDPQTLKRLANTTIEVDGVTYKLDSKGRATKDDEAKNEASNKAPKTKVSVEKTYYTDIYVDDETLLAAIIRCEAGNQKYAGKEAVGLVIMNRMNSSRFPSKLREIVYQKQQFAPARDGSLTKTLKQQSLIDAGSRKAAKAVMERINQHQKGTDVVMTIEKQQVKFGGYLFFMTQSAYRGLGLSARVRKIGDHVFFQRWG